MFFAPSSQARVHYLLKDLLTRDLLIKDLLKVLNITRSIDSPAASAARSAWVKIAIRMAVAVGVLAPLQAHAWWNHDWSYRKSIQLDTSAAGAKLQGDVDTVPVLVRLHDGVLKFTDTNPDGSDLRFVDGDDKTPLKFHIEKFDSLIDHVGFVWVSVPKLKAAGTQTIWMYYGNTKVAVGDDVHGTYDSDQVAVYHFATHGVAPEDSSQYKNNLIGAAASEETGPIGASAKFDGKTALTLPPASTSLPITASGERTIALWIKPSTAGQTASLFSQGDAANGLTIGLKAGAPYMAVNQNGVAQQSVPSTPLDTTAHHLALIAGAAQVNLYVDGKSVATLSTGLPAVGAAGVIGAATGAPNITAGFVGELDELQISKVARSVDYLTVLAGNQSGADKLLSFGGDEVQSTWSSGYVGIILSSVTIDGWVIIGVLIVMAAISWMVMVGKGRQVGQVEKANKSFVGAYDASRGDLDALKRTVGNGPMAESPLGRMFVQVCNEITQRLTDGGSLKSARLSAASIEAIRAVLDAAMTREMAVLNRFMVLLTIAISGGPFIGLLGTVVGVMITFASIAAAGDVNVNAIAPGISAALVATVAGLIVAIPALFGYNYLLSRIKDTTNEMQAFLNAFIARLAETAAHDQLEVLPGKHAARA